MNLEFRDSNSCCCGKKYEVSKTIIVTQNYCIFCFSSAPAGSRLLQVSNVEDSPYEMESFPLMQLLEILVLSLGIVR